MLHCGILGFGFRECFVAVFPNLFCLLYLHNPKQRLQHLTKKCVSVYIISFRILVATFIDIYSINTVFTVHRQYIYFK